MSEQSQDQAQDQERYGSRLARMFGYVTEDDRSKWQQQRAQNKKNISALKHGSQSSLGSMMDFGQRNVDSRLNAAHRIAEQQKFDQTHDKVISTREDPNSHSIIESVDYEFRQEGDAPDEDLEF